MARDLEPEEFLEALFEAWQTVWDSIEPMSLAEFGEAKVSLTAPIPDKAPKAAELLDGMFHANARAEIKERDGRVTTLPRSMIAWVRKDKRKNKGTWNDFAQRLVDSQA